MYVYTLQIVVISIPDVLAERATWVARAGSYVVLCDDSYSQQQRARSYTVEKWHKGYLQVAPPPRLSLFHQLILILISYSTDRVGVHSSRIALLI